MKKRSVQVIGDEVSIMRYGNGLPVEVIDLSFAEVRAAAEVLRAHLLSCMPPEIPIPAEPPPAPRRTRCKHETRVLTSAGNFCSDCGALKP